MKATTHLDIVSLEAKIFSGIVEMVVVTGVIGEVGVLPGHTPFLTTIKPGQIRLTLQGGTQDIYYISGGLLEVQPATTTILADTIIHTSDLDEAAAIAARDNAKRLLANRKSDMDITSVLAQISQATAKLHAIKLSKNKQHKPSKNRSFSE